MRTCFIKILGTPIPQQRPRLSKRGVFDPQSKEKKVIKQIIYLQTKHIKDYFKNPHVSFIFFMPIVFAMKNKLPSNNGFLRHEKKPDIDNLIKLYLDCLDGSLFSGDQQVSLGESYKFYGQNPGVLIKVEETCPHMAINANFLNNFLGLKKQSRPRSYYFYDSKFHFALKARLSEHKYNLGISNLPSF